MDMGAKNTGFIVLNLDTGGCLTMTLKLSCDMEFICQVSQAFSQNYAKDCTIGGARMEQPESGWFLDLTQFMMRCGRAETHKSKAHM